jgi:hypothetical protein
MRNRRLAARWPLEEPREPEEPEAPREDDGTEEEEREAPGAGAGRNAMIGWLSPLRYLFFVWTTIEPPPIA